MGLVRDGWNHSIVNHQKKLWQQWEMKNGARLLFHETYNTENYPKTKRRHQKP